VRVHPKDSPSPNKHSSFAEAVRAGATSQQQRAAGSTGAPTQAASQVVDTQGPVGVLFNGMEAVKESTVRLIAAGDEASRLGMSPLKPIDAAGLYRLPPSEVPAFSLEAELAKVAPMEQAEAIAAKERILSLILQSAALLPDGLSTKEASLKDAEELKTAIAKMKKKAPGDALMVEQLRLARQEHVGHAALIAQRQQEGREKAAKQKGEQIGAIDKMIDELVVLKTNVAGSFQKATAAWEAYNHKRNAQTKGILDEIDARIALIQARPPAPDPVPGPTGPTSGPTSVAPMLVDASQVQLQLNTFEAAVAQAKRDMEATEAMFTDHLASFTCDPTDFPTTLKEPEEDQWQLLHNLWAGLETMLRQEQCHGVQAPVTYGQLQAGTVVPRIVMGEALWNKAYPQKQPDESTIVTVQIRGMMWSSLQAHREKLTTDKRQQEAAKLALNAALEHVVTDFRHKRRRAEEAGPGVASGPAPQQAGYLGGGLSS